MGSRGFVGFVDVMILIGADGHLVLAVFATAAEPIGTLRASDIALAEDDLGLADRLSRRMELVDAAIGLWRQGCIFESGNAGERGDLYEITDVSRRIASHWTAAGSAE